MNSERPPVTSAFRTDASSKTPAHQHAYEKLREMILFGDLVPGQAVTILGLTNRLGAGMTPVREALRRLIAEDALIHKGNRRVTVPILTPICLDELGYMRSALEPELARRAAQQITPAQLNDLRIMDTALNKAIATSDVGSYLTHNYQFHAAIYDCAKTPIMAATVDRLWLRFGPSLRVVCTQFGTSGLPDKHAELLAALADSNEEGAAKAMADDVDQGTKQVRAALLDG